ncbi:hypothetical protein EYF80_018622 [Liparis tanakae]|uniref:Uncharacterized protein n=1 Tax=Liparis tanakae TaxID=230148 RepID=A0A4Z2I1J1_9TELE|nr:hypothetical protein EYF80_018622 [Liparis tanakae]
MGQHPHNPTPTPQRPAVHCRTHDLNRRTTSINKRGKRLKTHAMATLLPSMMMCLSSWCPGSLGSFSVHTLEQRDSTAKVKPPREGTKSRSRAATTLKAIRTLGVEVKELVVAASHCGVLRSAVTVSTFTAPPKV